MRPQSRQDLQPRGGERMQPTAQAVSPEREKTQSRRGERVLRRHHCAAPVGQTQCRCTSGRFISNRSVVREYRIPPIRPIRSSASPSSRPSFRTPSSMCMLMVGGVTPYAFPILFALSTSFCALSTTGGSIIFDPKLTTPRPRCCASSNAATIFEAFSISAAEGAKAS